MSQAPAPARPRSVLPDAVDGNTVLLLKSCSTLRLTYEIRLVTYMAAQRRMSVDLEVRPYTQLTPELSAFVNEHGIRVIRS